MAIEPLGTIMTAQAQAYQPKKNDTYLNSQSDIKNVVDKNSVVFNNTTIVKETNKSELNKDNKNYSNNNDNLSEEDKKKIKEYTNKINKKMINKGALFNIHEDTNRLQITIIDRETKEVLKEFPPEQFLDSIAKRMELTGCIFDEKG